MPMPSRVAIGNDHVAFDLKFFLKEHLEAKGFSVVNFGCDNADKVDYPSFARSVAMAIRNGAADWGVLICGSGIGISIAANRFPHIRAALVHDALGARLARQHNNANIVCLGAQTLGRWVARDCIDAFVSTDFDQGPHGHRVKMLGEMS